MASPLLFRSPVWSARVALTLATAALVVGGCGGAGTPEPPAAAPALTTTTTSPPATTTTVSSTTTTAGPTGPPLRLDPVTASFDENLRLTTYHTTWHDAVGAVTTTWTLNLQLVDPAGAPDPSSPGSRAAVDLGCTNAGVGLPNKPQTSVGPPTLSGHSFSWHHPDAVDSDPKGAYACDHTLQGPHGHQGLITVVVSDTYWSCTDSYKGTNSSTATSVDDGTASKAQCTRKQ